jgi:ABC-type nickel/cobalt efflux system permease component RcnA
MAPGPLVLIGAVAAVGVFHTMVPDHWAPITILARQQGWTSGQVVRAAAIAGSGHAVSTLIIAVLVWILGAALAVRFGNIVTLLSSAALIGFGLWIAVASLSEMRQSAHDDGHRHMGHTHVHRHGGGLQHAHYHEHHEHDWHAVEGNLAVAPTHDHEHKTSSRTALLLIIGSSPMVEGIPAFFAASRYGAAQLVTMALVFAVSTIATYVILCVVGVSGLQRINLGTFERYGEVLSGAFIALTGLVFIFIS